MIKKVLCWIFILVVLVCLYLLIRNNIETNTDFYKISIIDVTTVLLTIVIAYYLTQLSNNERKKKEEVTNIIEKVQFFVNSKESLFHNTFEKANVLMTLRKVNNKIELLTQYTKTMGITCELKYIKDKFIEYKEFVGENIENPEYLSQSDAHLLKSLKLIDDKCDEIKLKLYK